MPVLQFGDGGDQVLAVGNQRVELFARFLGLALGAEIDPAQPFAFELQPLDLALDILFLAAGALPACSPAASAVLLAGM